MAFSESLRIEELQAGRPSRRCSSSTAGAATPRPTPARVDDVERGLPRLRGLCRRRARGLLLVGGPQHRAAAPRHRRLRAGDRAGRARRSTASTSSCSRSTAAAGNSDRVPPQGGDAAARPRLRDALGLRGGRTTSRRAGSTACADTGPSGRSSRRPRAHPAVPLRSARSRATGEAQPSVASRRAAEAVMRPSAAAFALIVAVVALRWRP